jgi:hypothetical protein
LTAWPAATDGRSTPQPFYIATVIGDAHEFVRVHRDDCRDDLRHFGDAAEVARADDYAGAVTGGRLSAPKALRAQVTAEPCDRLGPVSDAPDRPKG